MKVSFFEKRIEPKNRNVNLSGFGRRINSEKTFGINSLGIRVFSFKQTDHYYFIVSIDTLYIPLHIENSVLDALDEIITTKKHHLILNSTHTHSAPCIFSKAFGFVDEDYIKLLLNGIFEGLKFCIANYEDGFLRINSLAVEPNIFINRRKLGWDIRSFFLKKRTVMLPNSGGGIDPNMRVVSVYNSKSILKSVIFNFSCHPVFDNFNNISADFVGEIYAYIKKKYKVPSMFLQGFCGDVRPNFTTTKLSMLRPIQFLKIAFNGEVFKDYSLNDFNYFVEKLIRLIDVGISKEFSHNLCSSKISVKEFSAIISSATSVTTKKIKTKIWVIEDIIFISIPAEVHSFLYRHLQQSFPDYIIMPLGYSAGMIGYLPAPEEIAKGGYEVSSSVNYGFDSPLSENSIERYIDQIFLTINSCIEGG